MARARPAKATHAGTVKALAPGPTLVVAEVPAVYRVHPPTVADCNLLGALLFQEPERALAEQHIVGRSLHAPDLLDYEMVSVAVKKARQGRGDIAADGIARYLQVPIELHEVDPTEVLALAQRYQLTAYDAAYLWLAAELKAPLATFDKKLGAAAQRHLGALE